MAVTHTRTHLSHIESDVTVGTFYSRLYRFTKSSAALSSEAVTQHSELHGTDGLLATVHVMSHKMFCRVLYTKMENASLYLRLKHVFVFKT